MSKLNRLARGLGGLLFATLALCLVARAADGVGIRIGEGASVEANTAKLYLTGPWENLGAFAPGTGTVEFDGTQQIVSGDTQFNIFKAEKGGLQLNFAAGDTFGANCFRVRGESGTPLILRSTTDGTQWFLNVAVSPEVSFVDVKDSNAAGGLFIGPASSVNSGNTVNWFADIEDPNCPKLRTPPHNSRVPGNGIVFSWSEATGATSYVLVIYDSTDTAVFNENIGNATAKILSLPLGVYTWKVQAVGAGGINSWSSLWTFTVVNNERVQKLLPYYADSGNFGHFGKAVAISGNWIIVGAPGLLEDGEPGTFGPYEYTGTAVLFERVNDTWIRRQVLYPTAEHDINGQLVSPGPRTQFGWAVDINGDMAVVFSRGCYTLFDSQGISGPGVFLDNFGYVYRRSGSSWNLETKISRDNVNGYYRMAETQNSISLDGDQLAVGISCVIGYPYSEGIVRIFKYNSSWHGWAPQQTISGSNASFGKSISLDLPNMAIGMDAHSGTSYPSLECYGLTNGIWQHEKSYYPCSMPVNKSGFDFEGDTVHVPLPDSAGTSNMISAYKKNDGVWSDPQETIRLSFVGESDLPGQVKVSGSLMAVGACYTYNAIASAHDPRLWIFRKSSSGEWKQIRKLRPDFGQLESHDALAAFTYRVDIDGNTAVASAPYDNYSPYGVHRGAVYVYDIDSDFDAPVLTSPAHKCYVPSSNITFIWEPVTGAEEYQIVITEYGSGNLVNTTQVNTITVTIPLTTGRKIWKVRPYDTDTGTYGPFSEIRYIN